MDHAGEDLERASLEALHGLADAALRRELGLALLPVADGLASVAPVLPASAITLNRAIGLGLGQALEASDIGELVLSYAERGVKRWFLHLHPEARSETVLAACQAAGLERTRGWQKFERGRDEPIPEVATELEIREIGPEQGAAFARIVCNAFDLGADAEPWLARLPGSAGASGEGWHAFMAFAGEEPAGAGGLFIRGEEAWTDFGATAPAHRGRGAQGANLAHRVRFALERGCRRVHTCTGEEVPGDPQHSYANIKRCGFRETYVRDNYAPSKPSS